jgi:peptidoglycan/xylan/chitin deacetylase (PgdA/CDA1 family)
MLTFDDAYLDFYEIAWPIIERSGFSAHVFVVTDKVGQTADWDSENGEPAPLMNWEQIVELAGRGVTFGSHLASHRRADYLTAPELLAEAARSRATLERVLGKEVRSLAAPFSIIDPWVEQVIAAAGYTRMFGDTHGYAPIWGSPFTTPRMGVFGEDDLDAFAAKLGIWREPPGPRDLA